MFDTRNRLTAGLICFQMLESLTHIPLFEDLASDQLALLEPLFESYKCPPDTTIFEQGDLAEYLYLILEGSVSIRYKPYDGPPIKVTHLREGNVFGWSAVVGRNHVRKKKSEKIMATTQTHSKEQQLRGLLERLSAYVEQYHGGAVDFVSFDGRTLKVRLGGACLGCPLQPATLHGWVAGTVHQFFPEVEVIEEK